MDIDLLRQHPAFTHFQYVGAPVKDGTDWQAWVVYAVSDDADLLVQTWVTATQLRPAT